MAKAAATIKVSIARNALQNIEAALEKRRLVAFGLRTVSAAWAHFHSADLILTP